MIELYMQTVNAYTVAQTVLKIIPTLLLQWMKANLQGYFFSGQAISNLLDTRRNHLEVTPIRFLPSK